MIELDKNRTSAKRSAGGSLFSSGGDAVPKELSALVQPQQTLSKNATSTKTSITTANQDYEKNMDPSAPVPSAPVHAARLNGLLKTLAIAEGAVAESIKARKLLIEGLEKLLDTNRAALLEEESQNAIITERRTEIDNKKKEVEDSIMRGFSNPTTPIAEASPGNVGAQQSPTTPGHEPDRPKVEAITPPPGDPDSAPLGYGINSSVYNNGVIPTATTFPPDLSFLQNLTAGYGNGDTTARPGSAKKRKLENDFPDLGGDDLDADVTEMLKQE